VLIQKKKKVIKQFPEDQKQICQFCIYGVQTVVNFLNESEDYIIEQANLQCNGLSDETAKRLCLTLVSLFGRQIIRFIKETGSQNPREVCQRFTLCPRDMKVEEVKPKAACTVCVMAVTQVQQMLNETEAEIIRSLLQQCALLPEQAQQYCRLVVNMYAKDLIDYVRRTIGEPRQLCTRIGVCQANNKHLPFFKFNKFERHQRRHFKHEK